MLFNASFPHTKSYFDFHFPKNSVVDIGFSLKTKHFYRRKCCSTWICMVGCTSAPHPLPPGQSTDAIAYVIFTTSLQLCRIINR